MNVAPPVAAPASVTVGGLTLTSAMTPEQRFEAIKSANVQPAQFHTDHTVAGMTADQRSNAERVAAGKAPPPTPAALEAANKPANVAPPQGAPNASRLSEFDEEMRKAGLQKPTSAEVPPGQVDAAGIAKLSKSYQDIMVNLERMSPSQARDSNLVKYRAQFNEELKEFYDGRKLGEKRSDFWARRDGTAPAATPVSQHPPQAWAEAHVDVASKDGMIPLERINKNGLSGYVLPKLVDGQTYHVSVFQELAAARAAGLSQKQVDSFIRTDMVNNGWIKA